MPTSMFSTMPTVPQTKSAFSPEPIAGNSLTQYLRSLNNSLAPQSEQYQNVGQGLVGASLPGFQAAGDTSQKALSTLQPSVDYWTKILSGDEKTQLQAIAPQVQQIEAGYAGALAGASKNMARGGYASTIQANLPFQQAQDVSNVLAKLQPAAAQALVQAAQSQGSIAEVQSRIAGTLAQLGLSETQLGQQIMQTLLQSLLAGRGQDVQEHGQAMGLAGQATGSFEQGLMSGIRGG
jgi:hypothetical protein